MGGDNLRRRPDLLSFGFPRTYERWRLGRPGTPLAFQSAGSKEFSNAFESTRVRRVGCCLHRGGGRWRLPRHAAEHHSDASVGSDSGGSHAGDLARGDDGPCGRAAGGGDGTGQGRAGNRGRDRRRSATPAPAPKTSAAKPADSPARTSAARKTSAPPMVAHREPAPLAASNAAIPQLPPPPAPPSSRARRRRRAPTSAPRRNRCGRRSRRRARSRSSSSRPIR